MLRVCTCGDLHPVGRVVAATLCERDDVAGPQADGSWAADAVGVDVCRARRTGARRFASAACTSEQLAA